MINELRANGYLLTLTKSEIEGFSVLWLTDTYVRQGERMILSKDNLQQLINMCESRLNEINREKENAN